ncbi:MAG: hypothetical protein ABI565_06480 [Vicinamibacteria bacterium]
MKKIRVAAVIACLLISACYDFDFPLDPKPLVPVDARLLGTWRCLGAQAGLDDDPGVVRISGRSDSIARWTIESRSADGSREKSEYDVHGSTIPGGSLLNALELGGKASGKWSFVRYTFLLPDVLRVQLVNDEPLAKVKDNAAALRQEIERRREDPSIYSDFLVCVRSKASATPSPSPAPTTGF